MKKVIILCLFTLSIWSCDNELNLTTDWEDIPIVYGMLAQEDEVHYVRVEKAFLDAETNAFELAKNPDSLYYSNALVQLERPAFNSTITLERVDVSKEGIEREEGVFATDPNYLYTFTLPDDEPFDSGESVTLTINTGESQKALSATTNIVGMMELVPGQPGDQLNWEYDRPIRFSWRPDPNAYIYDARLLINIEESLPGSNSEFADRQVVWTLAEGLVRTSFSETARERIEVLGEDFYRFMEGALEPTETTIRRFKSIEFVVTAGGEELVEFIRIRQANTGITSAQVVPTYTNIDGGVGLFTSRSRVSKPDIRMGAIALDSLANGIYTKNLNFR